jgi:peptidoglycan/LPS O-acetylase OafA/YrhL
MNRPVIKRLLALMGLLSACLMLLIVALLTHRISSRAFAPIAAPMLLCFMVGFYVVLRNAQKKGAHPSVTITTEEHARLQKSIKISSIGAIFFTFTTTMGVWQSRKDPLVIKLPAITIGLLLITVCLYAYRNGKRKLNAFENGEQFEQS